MFFIAYIRTAIIDGGSTILPDFINAMNFLKLIILVCKISSSSKLGLLTNSKSFAIKQ
ncbi:uncharacterized protein METZ01_LOCUS57647 [marine metagenome]|uniref:Uncharacterized protein n=1 Tax=marine metagenome TaxID=408172 RepID=A0A381STZ1_9ZZZZ